MVNLILIGSGGCCGAISRYGIGLLVERLHPTAKVPIYGTLTVNLIGCLLIGIAYGFATRHAITRPTGLLLVNGFLGGFTTFSTFGLETLKLIHIGAYTSATLYVAISAVVGVALVAAGFELAK